MVFLSFCKNPSTLHGQPRGVCALGTVKSLQDDKKNAKPEESENRMRIILLTFLIYHLSLIILSAQTTFRLHIPSSEQAVFSENIKDFRLKPLENQPGIAEFQLPDSTAIIPLCHDLLQHFRQRSFLAASLDSLQTATASATTSWLSK